MEGTPHVKLSEKEKREMLRVISIDLHNIMEKPGRAAISKIAEKICAKYPGFSDMHGELKIGSGFSSIAKKIEERIDNLNRNSLDHIIKNKKTITDSEKNLRRLSIGCTNFAPQLNEEEEEEQNKTLTELQKKHQEGAEVKENILSAMKETFALQRKEISKCEPTKTLTNKIPYLFYPAIFISHFEKVTGTTVDSIYKKLENDKNLHMEFFASKISKNNICKNIEEAKLKMGNDVPLMGYGLLGMVACYFKESVAHLYIQVKVSNNIKNCICCLFVFKI